MEIPPLDTFKTIIVSTPRVSIGCFVSNSEGKILLSKRLVKEKLGFYSLKPKSKGVYQHFYNDNFPNEKFNTRNVVLDYDIQFDKHLFSLSLKQQSKYKWLAIDELLECKWTHLKTKLYFQSEDCLT